MDNEDTWIYDMLRRTDDPCARKALSRMLGDIWAKRTLERIRKKLDRYAD